MCGLFAQLFLNNVAQSLGAALYIEGYDRKDSTETSRTTVDTAAFWNNNIVDPFDPSLGGDWSDNNDNNCWSCAARSVSVWGGWFTSL
eukprot:5842011-Pyramimonas_sp.AAC.1